MSDGLLAHYEIKYTGVSAYKGDNLGVYRNGELIKGFNTLSDDYAHTNAQEYVNRMKGGRPPVREYL